jgi:MoxR-like ATPase
VAEFTAEELRARAEERGLLYPRHLLAEVVAALDSGRHVLLTGPPGAGKTSLAYVLADLARDAVRCTGYLAVTASADWRERQTVGQYVDTPEGVMFQPGVFLDAIQSGRWLLIDELNRANIDRAFGPLFTVLSNQPVTLHYKRPGRPEPISIVPAGAEAPPHTDALPVPRHWRIVATMNDVDRATLHRLSYALMRRFAFVEVTAAPDEVVRRLVRDAGELVVELFPVRRFVELGPGVFVDAARFASRRLADPDATPSRVLFEAFFAFVLPQLDLLADRHGRELFEALAPCFDSTEVVQLERAIRNTICPRPFTSASPDRLGPEHQRHEQRRAWATSASGGPVGVRAQVTETRRAMRES